MVEAPGIKSGPLGSGASPSVSNAIDVSGRGVPMELETPLIFKM